MDTGPAASGRGCVGFGLCEPGEEGPSAGNVVMDVDGGASSVDPVDGTVPGATGSARSQR